MPTTPDSERRERARRWQHHALDLRRSYVATAVSRQGYLPDLGPLLQESGGSFGDLRSSLLPRSYSSPSCSPPSWRKPGGPGAGALTASVPVPGGEPRASLWGAVFNMCSATLGAGALSLPYAFEQVGAAGGLALLLLTACTAHYSVVLLISAIERTGARSYEELTVRLFGKRLGFLVELNIIAFCFGTVIAYTVAVGDLLEPLIALRAVRAAAPWVGRRVVMCLFWACCMLPLSLVERISALQCTSLFGVVALFYLGLSVVVHALLHALHVVPEERHHALAGAALAAAAAEPHAEPHAGGFELLRLSMRSFEAVAIIMFAFTCQVNVPSIYEEMERSASSASRMSLVSIGAMSVCLGAYALIGTAGYYDAPDSQHGNLLDNYCVIGSSEGARLMLPAFGAMLVTVLMAYPLNIHPCRYTLDVMACAQLGASHRTARHVGWTVLIAASGLVIALYVPGINLVFQLMGSTSSAFVCFVMPAAFGLRLGLPEASGPLGGFACRALFGGGIVVGALATAVTAIGILNPHEVSHAGPCAAADLA